MISLLRNRGNFEYNTREENSETPILARRRHKLGGNAKKTLPCPTCKSYISYKVLSAHHQRCSGTFNPKSETRSVVRNARSLITNIHPLANEVMITKIIPPMRRDSIFNTLRQDKLIILYGNHLSPKYTGHQEYMIRNKMRSLARLFQIVNKMHPEIDELLKLFRPKYFETAMKGIVQYAGLDKVTALYRSPKSALEMVHAIKVCCNVLNSIYIMEENKEHKEKEVKRFEKLLATQAAGSINKPAQKNLIDNKRKIFNKQEIKIPLSDDIAKFKHFLLKGAEIAFQKLSKDGFQYKLWKDLGELSLLYIVVFNRKRSGESHRVLVEDFENIHQLSNTSLPEVYQTLSSADKKTAQSIFKLVIRGKLDKPVTAFVNDTIKMYLDYIYHHRNEAYVPEDNPYLFGLPGKLSGRRHRCLETCSLMRKYTKLANLQDPTAVRTIPLRKHFATKISTFNLKDAQQDSVQEFMGHKEKIHKGFYRQQVVTKDLLIAHLLNKESEDIEDLGQSSEIQNVSTTDKRKRKTKTHHYKDHILEESEESCDDGDQMLLVSSNTTKSCSTCYDEPVAPNNKLGNSKTGSQIYGTPKKSKLITPPNEKNVETENLKNKSCSSRYYEPVTLTKNLSNGKAGSQNNKTRNKKLKKPANETKMKNLNFTGNHIRVPKTRSKENINYSIEKDTDDPSEPEQYHDSGDSFQVANEESSERSDDSARSEVKVVKKKIHWNTPEKYAARRQFMDYIEKHSLPPVSACETAIHIEPDLRSRNPGQIRTWVSNQIKTKLSSNSRVKHQWSTPEKHIIRHLFKKHIENNTYPSSSECSDALSTYPELKHRTIPSIKSFIQHSGKRFKHR